MQNQNMEDVDKDLIVDIPDTPDRFPARHAANGGKFVRKESTSLTGRFRNSNFTPEENLNRPIVRIKMKNESRGLQVHPPKAPVISGEEKIDPPEENLNRPIVRVKMKNESWGPQIHPSKAPVIIGEEKIEPRDNHSRLFRKTTPDKNSKDGVRDLVVNKGKAICDEKSEKKEAHKSSLHFAPNCSKTYGGELKGKEKVVENSSRRSDSAANNGKGVDLSDNSQRIIPPRVGGRKRLVRNGCISPQNIATRAQQQRAENSQKPIEPKPAEQNQAINLAANSQPSFDINEIVSEDNFRDRFKGKRVSNEHDAELIDLSGSTPRSRHKEAREIGGPSGDLVGSCRDLGGWRRTHTNTTRNIDDVGSRFPKRQKTELPSRNRVAMGSGDSGIVFLDSSGRSSSSSSSTIQSHQPEGLPAPIVNIDDLSPAVRHSDAQAGQMRNYESDARMRQLEADEAMARELQEQLYGEATILGGSDIDENIAWSLQQEEDLARAPSNQSRQAPRPRTVSRTQANRHPSSRTTGAQARAPYRRSNLRSRILGQSRAPPASRVRDVQFPLDMDLEMRIDMLEALEAAIGGPSRVGTASHILQLQRDFNENDYEMLLALDDNNHQHGGASTNLINSLPESTVQTENYEECAVCLETPTIGETIRHLPCLHKFHKECIDLWLAQKSSCPVCKSSIT